ncbi:MAG: Zn-dependent hydrolase [Bacteroidales bacterium]|nr:Zn-dependent hydrolase [Bacteroidales bacterium]
MKKTAITVMICVVTIAMIATSCKSKTEEPVKVDEKSEIQLKVEEYANVDLTSELVSSLTDNEKQLVDIFIQIGDIMDDLFWKQTFGDKQLLDTISDPYIKDFALINYGAWDRLGEEKPFVPGYGEKPLGCQYYPTDMTKEEFDALDDPDKTSLYTAIRRDEEGKLKVVWYRDEYKEELTKVCDLLDSAIAIAEDPGLKKYLVERKNAFQTDDYFASDMAWMDMKESKLDFVVGPIENYDDRLYEGKASYEAFVLLKDVVRSNELTKFVAMLPDLQKELPCDPKYKTFVPGNSSDLNVYDVIYYAGDCNSASKTIAINLPNDDRVQAKKGARRLQLRNAMKAKFEKIMMPIGQLILEPDQQKNLKFDAFFWNVTFHEVAHGLGIKQTINGKGSVDDAMGTEKTTWEEAKADILGLFLVCNLIQKGEITEITEEEAVTTYITGILRSVRFGATESHGKANILCYNVMAEKEAFSRNADGTYHIDMEKAREAINYWGGLILTTQGEGDVEFATQFREEHGQITDELKADLNKINGAGIPRDIRFNQGKSVLGL